MPGFLKSKPVIAVAIVAALVGLYAFLGYRVAPGIVRSQAIKFVAENYHRELAVGEVRIDPFALQLEIRDLALPDADGTPMLAFRRLFVEFEVASLWERVFVFREVALDGPDARAVVRTDGRLNFADLALPEGKPAEKKEPSELPSVWLKSFVLSDGKVGFADRSRARPFMRTFSPVAFTLKDFRTTPDGGGFRLSARSEQGEGFDWNGRFALAPVIASRGEFAIHGLKAAGVAEYLGDALPFELSSGLIELGGSYDVSLGDVLAAHAKLHRIEVSGLGLRARGEGADWVTIPGIVVADTAVAMPAQSVEIAGITVNGLQAQAWMSADGSINLTRLFSPGTAPATPAPQDGSATAQAPVATTSAAPAGRPWTVRLAAFDLAGASIALEDRKADPVKQFTVAPLNVHLKDMSLDLSKPLPIELDAVVNNHAPFDAKGTVTPSPLAADLAISLSKARMQILQPYVLPVADLTINDGLLAIEGRVRLAPPEADGPELRFEGDVTIDGFKSVDNAMHQDLVNWGELALRKIAYTTGPDAASVDQVILRQPYARVIISPERIINIAAVLDPKGTAATLAERREAAEAEARLTPAQKRKRDEEREAAADRAAKERKAHGGGQVQAALAPLPKETLPVRIRAVKVEDGTLNFTDLYVRPNFSAKVYQLSGSMSGLSSDPRSHAKVDFKGKVDEFSPVRISGEVQPFSFERYADIGMKFENISLPIFNPYSGELAGYSIAKGKLTTDLHYKIVDRQLDAQHKIRIDQLEWGEPTAGKGEATLPVKFATALLKDRHGVIDLDVPVTGTLDDPTFRIGPIVWKVIKNLIVKAVTAPFALLGALFEGAEEAQFIDFAPGGADLDAATAQRLGALAKSLVEKPGIKVDVPIGVLPDVDGPALVEQAWQRELAASVAATVGGRKDAAAPSYESLDPEKKVEVLTALATRLNGAKPKVPEPPPAPEGASRDEKKSLEQSAAIEFLTQQARDKLQVSVAELDALGEARGKAIEHALLDGGQLDPTRVFLSKEGKIAGQDGKVRYQLGLQ